MNDPHAFLAASNHVLRKLGDINDRVADQLNELAQQDTPSTPVLRDEASALRTAARRVRRVAERSAGQEGRGREDDPGAAAVQASREWF